MSWTVKPKSEYARQLKKLEERAKQGLETSPRVVEKYYAGYVTKSGTINTNPMWKEIETTIQKLNNPKLVWNGTKSPRPTKPCLQCGETIEKPLREGAQTWEQRKFCNVPCKKLHHETLHNAKVLKLN